MSAPKIAAPVGRSVKEWIGKTPDEKPPAYVLLRIFRRASGICHISGRKIEAGEKWQAEHIKALWEGGENRESNMAPALVDAHKVKSAEEAARRAKADAAAKVHLGLRTRPVAKIKSAPFPRSERTAKREPRPSLPRRDIFSREIVK